MNINICIKNVLKGIYQPIDSDYLQIGITGNFSSSFHLYIFFSAKHMFKKKEKWTFPKKYSLITFISLNPPQIW